MRLDPSWPGSGDTFTGPEHNVRIFKAYCGLGHIEWSVSNKLRTQLQSLCKQKKRNRVRQITDNAARAAAQHDSRGLYEAVRALTPKQARRCIRFRTDQGALHSPAQELKILIEHFTIIMGHGHGPEPTQWAPAHLITKLWLQVLYLEWWSSTWHVRWRNGWNLTYNSAGNITPASGTETIHE